MSRSREPYVMIVEDDLSVSHLFSELFQSEGYRVKVFQNGAHAVMAVHDGMPDVIVSDIVLPGIDGFKLCEQLKRQFTTIKIVLITGADLNDSDRQIAKIRGAEAIIEKSRFREIVAVVKSMIGTGEKEN